MGIHLPDVGNTLGGGASQPDASNTLGGYAYMLTLAFTLFIHRVSNTLGAAPYTVLTSVCSIDTFRLDANDFMSH
jgi:hypothetical protein